VYGVKIKCSSLTIGFNPGLKIISVGVFLYHQYKSVRKGCLLNIVTPLRPGSIIVPRKCPQDIFMKRSDLEYPLTDSFITNQFGTSWSRCT